MEKKKDEILALDKVAHFVVCWLMVCVAVILLNGALGVDVVAARSVAFLAAVAVGVAKELWDKSRGGVFDLGDLLADALGAGAGVLMSLLL